MDDKTLLVVGAVAVGGFLLLSFAKTSQQTQLRQQQLQIANQYQQSTPGQIGSILASAGSFFNSGALNNLVDAFRSPGTSNQPGLYDSAPVGANDPGLIDDSGVDYYSGF